MQKARGEGLKGGPHVTTKWSLIGGWGGTSKVVDTPLGLLNVEENCWIFYFTPGGPAWVK